MRSRLIIPDHLIKRVREAAAGAVSGEPARNAAGGQRVRPTMRIQPHLLLCCLAAFLFTACVDDPDANPDEVPVADDAVFHEIVATLQPDGTVTFAQPRAITVREEREQNAMKARMLATAASRSGATPGAPDTGVVVNAGFGGVSGTATRDTSCAWESLWVYSRTDWTGDRICFIGNGILYMKNYDRFGFIAGMWLWIGNWRLAWGSYWPGTNSGGLNGKSASGVWQSTPFPRYGRQGIFHFDDGLDFINLL